MKSDEDKEFYQETENEIEPWFWQLLESCDGNMEVFKEKFRLLPKHQMERFILYYDMAAESICAYYEGPYIKEIDGHLSEDSTEDLNHWIVSQGKRVWMYANSNEVDFDYLLNCSNQTESEKISNLKFPITFWDGSPHYLAESIYRKKYLDEETDNLWGHSDLIDGFWDEHFVAQRTCQKCQSRQFVTKNDNYYVCSQCARRWIRP